MPYTGHQQYSQYSQYSQSAVLCLPPPLLGRTMCPEGKKKDLFVCEANRSVKKFPAPCYSPIVKFTVPSPLEALTTVFGKGTCVTPPPWAPEKITMKKGKSMETAAEEG